MQGDLGISQAAVLAASVIYYTALLIGAVVIARQAGKDPERGLWLKLVGYGFLAAFTFRLNSFPLPVGSFAALLLKGRAHSNKRAKMAAVLLGCLLFLAGLFPLAERVEAVLVPKDRIGTYLDGELDPHKRGFNILFLKQDSIIGSLFENTEAGRQMYDAMADSVKAGQPDYRWQPAYRLEIHQDADDDRFRRLSFETDQDGQLLRLQSGGSIYYFETIGDFRVLFAEFI